MKDIISTIFGYIKEYHTYVNLGVGVLIFLFMLIFRNRLSNAILKSVAKLIYKSKESKEAFVTSLQKPLSVFFLILGLFSLLYLNVTASPILKGFKIITILIICWGVMNYLSNNVTKAFKKNGSDDSINVTAIKFISNIIRILVVVLAVVMIISELGYNINGLITGLGVGGLAVSLAAQDAVKNLISGFIIVFDKPFKVGDYIQAGTLQGTVLDVKMRSTKIRLLDDSVVTLPNSKLTDDAIVNISRMDKRLIDSDIGIVYSTDNKTVEKCLADIREYLKNSDKIINEPIRVEFKKLDNSCLTINIFCYTPVTDIHEYYKLLSEVNLNIKKIIEDNETEFAFPSSSIYIEKK